MLLYNSCKSEFENSGAIIQRGPQQMLLEGFYDLTSGYTDCVLNFADFVAEVKFGNDTITQLFYTGYDLYDVPPLDLYPLTISNIISQQPGIDTVTYDLETNQFVITTDCNSGSTFLATPIVNTLNIVYDISCVQCEPSIYWFVKCDEVQTCPYGNLSYGPADDPNDIFDGWYRFAMYATNKGLWKVGGVYLPTGLQPDGTVDASTPGNLFYTGDPRYLGAFAYPTYEGEDVGPTPANNATYLAQNFYYSTTLNKFMIAGVTGQQPNGTLVYDWATFNPTQNVINTLVNPPVPYGYPTTAWNSTNSTQWNTASIPGPNTYLTTNGSNNTVIYAYNKITTAGGNPLRIVCSLNSSYTNGFYSKCEFGDYVHEVTLGSRASDDDWMGLVLAAKQGASTINPDRTDTLMLLFVNNSGFGYQGGVGGTRIPRVEVHYNFFQDSYAFTDGTNYSSLVYSGTNTPFTSGNFIGQGQIRVKVEKTGTIFKLYCTQRLGLDVPLGGSAPYSLICTIDLADSTTWTQAPSYAVGDELLKFSNSVRIGYTTNSQADTSFYDFQFEGIQVAPGSIYSDTVTDIVEGDVYRFEEIEGCWVSSGITSTYDTLTTLTVNSSYDSCSACTPSVDMFVECNELVSPIIIYNEPLVGLVIDKVYRFNDVDGCYIYSGTTDNFDVVQTYTVSSSFDTCTECIAQCSEYLGHDEPQFTCTSMEVDFLVKLVGPVGCVNGLNGNCPQATIQYSINSGGTVTMNSYVWGDEPGAYTITENCQDIYSIQTIIPNISTYDQQTITIDYTITYLTPEPFTFTETIEVYVPGC